MTIVHTLVLCLVLILNSIDLCPSFDCLPNGEPIPGFTRSGSPPSYSSSGRRSPGRPHRRTELQSLTRSPPEVPPLRTRHPYLRSLGFELEELSRIRLTPHINPNRVFELQRYIFPPDKPLHLKIKNNARGPMPTEEQIVLKATNGDVFAIMTKLDRKTVFRGLYTYTNLVTRRVKMNMFGGSVQELTPEEAKDSPLGRSHPILQCFDISGV